MTALPLFDALVRQSTPSEHAGPAEGRLTEFAEKLVADSLAEFARISEYERQFVWPVELDPAADLAVMRATWRLYLEWADEAEQVLDRVSVADSSGGAVVGVTELNLALGRTRARLTVTPEQIARSKEQARQGQFVPAKELRDELNARLRA